MKKRILLLILSLSVCICVFTSCGYQPLRLYEAYICDMEDYFFVTGIDLARGQIRYNTPFGNMYEFDSPSSVYKENIPDKMLTLNGKTVYLKYKETDDIKSYCEDIFDVYRNDEYGINAYFFEESDRLNYLYLGRYEYMISDTLISSEAQLLDLCNGFLTGYVGALDRYEISIETKIWQNDGNGTYTDRIEGFATDSEKKVTYEVNYNFSIDGLLTTDAIKMVVEENGALSSVSMNMVGDFDDFSDVDIDMERCDSEISSEVERMCDVDDYNYLGYDARKLLIKVEGKMCVLYFICPIYEESLKDENMYIYSFEAIVPVASEKNIWQIKFFE